VNLLGIAGGTNTSLKLSEPCAVQLEFLRLALVSADTACAFLL
jgi:hypothetical protein